MEIGKQLKEARIKSHLTQEMVSEKNKCFKTDNL